MTVGNVGYDDREPRDVLTPVLVAVVALLVGALIVLAAYVIVRLL